MAEYKEFVLSIAETVVYVKKLTDEQYRKWRKEALELADQSTSEIAGKVLELIDAYRKRKINVCN